MAATPPPTDALLTRAAELRAGGLSWEAVAAKLGRAPGHVRRWPDRFPDRWRAAIREAERRHLLETVEAMTNEDAVFVDERDDIGDGAEGGEADGGEEKVTEAIGYFFGFAGSLTEGPGELEGDAGAAETSEGIVVAGEAGVNDGGGVRQSGGGLVGVGDDELEAEPACGGGLRTACDAASDGDDDGGNAFGRGANGIGG